jgi:hypothetical protein
VNKMPSVTLIIHNMSELTRRSLGFNMSSEFSKLSHTIVDSGINAEPSTNLGTYTCALLSISLHSRETLIAVNTLSPTTCILISCNKCNKSQINKINININNFCEMLTSTHYLTNSRVSYSLNNRGSFRFKFVFEYDET